MVIKIKKLTQPTNFNRRILLYGEPGSGKSFLVGTAQNVKALQDVLVIDLDGGSSTLSGTGTLVSEGRKIKDVEEVLWALAQKSPEVASVKTLVLDGASELAKRELAEIAEEAAKNQPNKRNRDLNQMADYMLSKNRLLRIFRMARDIPDITVIITAWAKMTFPKIGDVVNKDAKPTVISPDFTDAVADTLMGMVDDAWFLQHDSKADRRLLFTANHDNVKAKTRNPEFANQLTTLVDGKPFPVVINPTMQIITDAFTKAFSNK